jgi:hypothetical protein
MYYKRHRRRSLSRREAPNLSHPTTQQATANSSSLVITGSRGNLQINELLSLEVKGSMERTLITKGIDFKILLLVLSWMIILIPD